MPIHPAVHRGTPQRFVALVAGMLLVTAAPFSGLTRPAAAIIESFNAEANAAAVRMSMYVTNGPGTDTPFEAPGPVAHASVNALGSSEAFASFPYPGATAVSVPGLLP